MIILNKHELVNDREYDLVLDAVNDLNLDTTKVKFSLADGISADLIFGLDSKLFELANKDMDSRGFKLDMDHHEKEIDLIRIKSDLGLKWNQSDLDSFLKTLPIETFYRVKGIILLDNQFYILNWAFGRHSLTEIKNTLNDLTPLYLNLMGVHLKDSIHMLEASFGKANISLV